MAVATQVHPASPAAARRRDLLPVGVAIEGGGLAVIVALDGSPGWRVARFVFVVALTIAAVSAVRRGGSAARQVIGLTAGITGVVVGSAIGLMGGHVSVKVLCALGMLVTALFLTVTSAASLVRRLPGWWRLLGVPVALVLLAFVVVPFTFAVYATNAPPDSLGFVTPADRGLSYETVRLTARDGVSLAAWWVPSTNGAAVVVLAGSGSNRSNVVEHVTVLARHGYGVLALDHRGHGESGGHAMEFGWYGDLDIDAAVSFLEGRADRVGVVGLSMGGEEAVGAMGSDPRIAAVVGEGVTGRTLDDHAWMPRHVGGWVQRGLEWVMYGVADLLSGAERPDPLVSSVRDAAPRPVLLIVAGKVASEAMAAEHLFEASPANVEVWEVPDAGHTDGLQTHPDEWIARVTSFLDRALLQVPAG
jgi:uncharacterized protein